MITRTGLYFEGEKESDYFGKTIEAIHIYHDGKATMIKRRENGRFPDNIRNYESIEEFAKENPVTWNEIVMWTRRQGLNLNSILQGKGRDTVPVTKRCHKCANILPVSRFPINGTTFDGAHDDCCNCRIAECKKIKAYCTAPEKPECKECPVRKSQ